MANADVKKKMKNSGLKHWEVANEIGISEATFTRWLRLPLPEDKRKQVNAAISSLIAQRKGATTT